MNARTLDNATLRVDRAGDVRCAADALAAGTVVGHGFANIYMISAGADAATVRRVNTMVGRPTSQVGSISTTRSRIAEMWDWDRIPAPLNRRRVLGVMDAFFGLGPFGFRGPAAAHIPAHLSFVEAGIRATEVVAPGYACPSNEFLEHALEATQDKHLHITSATRSRQVSAADDSPAHWKARALRAEFGDQLLMLEHEDEQATRRRYLGYQPMSTTVLAFHRLGIPQAGRPTLVLERHGSLHVHQVRQQLDELGFGLTLAPSARNRLLLRDYAVADRVAS
jgi:hypothetical protein